MFVMQSPYKSRILTASQYINRKPRQGKPTAHISYDEGLHLVREFLTYAAGHTVDELQAFTGQWVPSPRWVKLDEVPIPKANLERSAELVQAQLGHHGIDRVGGKTWWQWRYPEHPLRAEWIEMRADYHARKAVGDDKGQRIILYVHGGAYFFGGVGEHRYQMQRHARKLKARVFAPRYRLAPQFPFPCGLFDCISAYLYLLEQHDPSTILFAGDSAGGGMVVSMLVVLRDQGIPLPAGAMLLSPWVDLTHSFPSLAGDGAFDYIPAHGFHQKPSMSWPPPNDQDMKNIARSAVESLVEAEKKGLHATGKERSEKQKKHAQKEEQDEQDAIQGFTVDAHPSNRDEVDNKNNPASTAHPDARPGDTIPGPGHNLSIMLDGKMVEILDQIQMYATNQLLAHPLVSPVLQTSLGGLPPLLIQTGGGELLRDEQIYLAHKAANPAKYAPSDRCLDEYDPHRETLKKYPPTQVHLQVWEDLCHVPHTLSFTRPAKYMYRGVAQFGAWAYAHARKVAPQDVLQNDAASIISSIASSVDNLSSASMEDLKDSADSGADNTASAPTMFGASRDSRHASIPGQTTDAGDPIGNIGSAGDDIPAFIDNMIRQRVTRYGVIYPLAPESQIPALNLDPASMGVIKEGPVRKWLQKKSEWDQKFAREKRKVQKLRTKQMAQGYDVIGDEETPPPTALAGRRRKDMPKLKVKKGHSWGLAMWSGWGSKHDESTLDRAEGGKGKAGDGAGTNRARQSSRAERSPQAETTAVNVVQTSTATDPRTDPVSTKESSTIDHFSSNGAALDARDVGIAPAPAAGPTTSTILAERTDQKVAGSDNTYLSATSSRPHNGTVAYPFKLRNPNGRTVSTVTLDSAREGSIVDGREGDVTGLSRPMTGDGAMPLEEAVVRDHGQREPGPVDEMEDKVNGAVVAERPPMQTFVTAHEF